MAEVLEKKAAAEPLFGKKERKLISDPLTDNNPITVQVLGICSALAVTSLLLPSIIISIAVVFVCAFSSLVTSLLRNSIPKSVRMIVQLVIIATLVTVVELSLKAFAYPVYKDLTVYIGLIITNCIVMGRLEAFAMANKPWRSFIDGVGNGLGYGLILVIVAFFRELFGKGTLFAGTGIGMRIIGPNATPEGAEPALFGGEWFGLNQLGYLLNTEHPMMSWYSNNNIMVLPAAAMFVIGILIWIQRARNPKLVDIS